MKSNKLVISSILVGILAATSASANAPDANKLPNYVAGKATLTQAKLIQGTPCAGVNFTDLENRIRSNVAQHGSSIVPVVLTTVPTAGVSPTEFAVAVQKKWHSQGLPDNAVVVVMQCTAQHVYAATVPDRSLVTYVDVQSWQQAQKGFLAQIDGAPGEYAFNVMDWLGGTVQVAQANMAKATQVAQAPVPAVPPAPVTQYIPQPAVETGAQVAVDPGTPVAPVYNIAPPNPVKGGVPTWVWVTLGVFGFGLVVFVIYRLVRRPDEEDVVTSNSNVPPRGHVPPRNIPEPRSNVIHRPVHHTPVQHTVVHSGPSYNYGFGGRQVVVAPADVAYYAGYAPAWAYGYDMAWNIATMIGVYESLEWMYLNGEMNRALALGYVPGYSRDMWMEQQLSTLDPAMGYYQHPLMQDSGWTQPVAGDTIDYNPLVAGDTVDPQNAANGWEDAAAADATLGNNQVDENPLVAGDDNDPANVEAGWETAGDADNALGHTPAADDQNPLAGGDDTWSTTENGDNTLVAGDNDTDGYQTGVEAEEQPVTQDDGYQVGVEEEVQPETQDDGWQVAAEEEAPADTNTGSDDDYQVSVDPEPEPDYGNDDNFSVDTDTGNDGGFGGDDNSWS